ncbi:MAG: ATP-binding protein, partial [Gemmatimonadetes bacterium]|nr:ATP-binding protein [Gemmatimonadota bacterium]
TIADTGVGIEPDRLAKLFEPAFTNKGGAGRVGLGMGLAIARRVVSESEGTLEIQSKIDEGTDVTLRLPLVADPA